MRRALALFSIVVIALATLLTSRGFLKPVQATTTTVNIGNDWYSNSASNNCGSPCVTNIGVGDTVHWVWIGTHQHSTTSDAGSSEVWDSGEHGMGNTFDLTF
ncbi:MAG: cupredoxin domain-containing protein, partial [bacterium]